MYTLLIGPDRTDAPVEQWLREHGPDDSDLMVLSRDVVAAQLLRSDTPPDLVVRIGADGLDMSPILDASAECGRELPPVLVLADAEGEEMVRELGEPAIRAVRSPISRDSFLKIVADALTPDSGVLGMSFEAKSPIPELHFGHFVGESTAMHRVYRSLQKVARAETTCLVTGESGTGKELAAAVIHELSDRQDHGLVAVNCGAIPENLLESEFFGHKKGAFTGAVSDHKGRFQMADKGTLFLDEIGEMLPSLQVKLLRALQTREVTPVGASKPQRVDVRVVAATNRDPSALKHDVLARFPHRIHLPGLDARREDVPLLVRSLLRGMAERRPALGRFLRQGVPRLTPRLWLALHRHRFTGHVRELQQLLWASAAEAEGDWLDTGPEVAVSPEPAAQPLPATSPDELGPEQIEAALVAADGVKERAWRALGLRNRHQLRRLMQKHGLT